MDAAVLVRVAVTPPELRVFGSESDVAHVFIVCDAPCVCVCVCVCVRVSTVVHCNVFHFGYMYCTPACTSACNMQVPHHPHWDVIHLQQKGNPLGKLRFTVG